MKKLMIAAAAAAMIGGAYAEDPVDAFVYDFTASLKTTVAKEGSVKPVDSDPIKVELARDNDGTWWYEGDEGQWLIANGYAEPDAKKVYKLSKKFTSLKANDPLREAVALAFADEADYHARKNNQGGWCISYTYKITQIPQECYRKSGSKKLKGIMTFDGCDATVTIEDLLDEEAVTWSVFNLFGSNVPEKCKTFEVYGDFGTVGDANGFVFAGQGSGKEKLFKYNGDSFAGINSLSGNIVGILQAPMCGCCSDEPAFALGTCEDSKDLTAAYGTWSVKFNKKATTALWDETFDDDDDGE